MSPIQECLFAAPPNPPAVSAVCAFPSLMGVRTRGHRALFARLATPFYLSLSLQGKMVVFLSPRLGAPLPRANPSFHPSKPELQNTYLPSCARRKTF